MIEVLTNEQLTIQLFAMQDVVNDLSARMNGHVSSSWGAATPSWPHGIPLFPVREIHGPIKEAVDSTHSMTMVIDFDEFVAKLHSAKLRLKLTNLRSTVSAATSAAGGGTTATSLGGSAHTHTINATTTQAGGGTTVTSAAGSLHNHTVSGGTAGSSGDHGHSVPDTEAGGTGTTGAGSSHNHSSATTDGADGTVGVHTHTVSGGSGSESSHTHTGPSHNHTFGQTTGLTGAHTHSLSGITNTAESTHTHSVTLDSHSHSLVNQITAANESSHTHDVTISSHTHTITLTYGVFDGPAPVTPAVTVTINGTDRTVALGGPWNSSPANPLDVTAYLRETSGEPLTGANTIVFTSNEAIAIEATLKSVVIPQNLLAAGLS